MQLWQTNQTELMASTRICKHCAQPILGNYLRALNMDWHPEHFCCALCHQPITEERFYLYAAEPCHPACYEAQIAPRCTICHKALVGKHQTNNWGDHFCSEHAKELAACNYCGRLVPHTTKRMRRRAVDHIRCDICAATAIETVDQAQWYIPHLMHWVETQGTHFRQKSFRIEVLNRVDFLAREGGRRDPLGLTISTRYLRNKRIDHTRLESVAILQGLPLPLFVGVCIHELGHVWLVQHNIVNLPLIDEEGFCELLAHRYYTSVVAPVDRGEGELLLPERVAEDEFRIDLHAAHFYAENIAQNGDPIYGDGFRKLKQIEERIGFAQLTRSLLRKKQLPL